MLRERDQLAGYCSRFMLAACLNESTPSLLRARGCPCVCRLSASSQGILRPSAHPSSPFLTPAPLPSIFTSAYRDLLHLGGAHRLHSGGGERLQRSVGGLGQYPLSLYRLHLLLDGDRLDLRGCHQALDLRLEDLGEEKAQSQGHPACAASGNQGRIRSEGFHPWVPGAPIGRAGVSAGFLASAQSDPVSLFL